jgi:RNA polymerase sigma factor (sigma-70 family)
MKRQEPCTEWTELLALRPEDLPPVVRTSLEAHLAVCPICSGINDHYRQIQASLETLPAPVFEPISYAWKLESGPELERSPQQESASSILERYSDYIDSLVRQSAKRIDLDVDELAQRVRFKLWQALENRPIAYPKAYIRAIVKNEITDLARNCALSQPFLEEEGQRLPDSVEGTIEPVLARAITPVSNPFLLWPRDGDKVVVEEMLRDQSSERWQECWEFVRKRVLAGASDIAQHEMDDIVQDIMMRVYKSLSTFRFESRLSTWIFRITQSCIKDVYRKRKRAEQSATALGNPHDAAELEPSIPTPDMLKKAEDLGLLRDELNIGLAALKEFVDTHNHPGRNRMILDMVIVEGCSLEEAARAVKCPPAVAGYIVREAQRFARQKLRLLHEQLELERNIEQADLIIEDLLIIDDSLSTCLAS